MEDLRKSVNDLVSGCWIISLLEMGAITASMRGMYLTFDGKQEESGENDYV